MQVYLELMEIERQINSMLSDRGLTRVDLYTFKGFTEGEKFVLLKLLEAKVNLSRDELVYMHQQFTNVIFLHKYLKK